MPGCQTPFHSAEGGKWPIQPHTLGPILQEGSPFIDYLNVLYVAMVSSYSSKSSSASESKKEEEEEEGGREWRDAEQKKEGERDNDMSYLSARKRENGWGKGKKEEGGRTWGEKYKRQR